MFWKSGFDNVHFIIGSPRSGTTWLLRALNNHPQVYCTENRLFGQFCEIWPDNDGSKNVRITLDEYIHLGSAHMETESCNIKVAGLESRLMREYIKTLLEVQRRVSGKKIIIDKVTPYLGRSVLTLSKIREFFPNAKLIQILRDGRDVATSGAFDWLLKDGVGTHRYRHFVEKQTDTRLLRFFDDKFLSLWAQYWSNPIVAFEAIAQDALLIRYEEMLADQIKVLGRLARYLSISDDITILTECMKLSSFNIISGGRTQGEEDPVAKARKGVAGDWRRYFTRMDGELLNQLVGDMLIKYGYENNEYWYDILPENLSINAAH